MDGQTDRIKNIMPPFMVDSAKKYILHVCCRIKYGWNTSNIWKLCGMPSNLRMYLACCETFFMYKICHVDNLSLYHKDDYSRVWKAFKCEKIIKSTTKRIWKVLGIFFSKEQMALKSL